MLTVTPPRNINNPKPGGMLSGRLGWTMGLGVLSWVVGMSLFAFSAAWPGYVLGPMHDVLGSATRGAIVGGLTCILLGMLLSRIEAKQYAAGIRASSRFIAMKARFISRSRFSMSRPRKSQKTPLQRPETRWLCFVPI